MMDKWHVGNALTDGGPRRGWLVGHFIEDRDDIRSTDDVEIKWGIHSAGDQRAEWTSDEYRTTVLLLVRGRFHLDLPGESIVLADEGDYVMWGARVDHSWRAEANSVVITVRWPSAQQQ
jgi:hypothetical protein